MPFQQRATAYWWTGVANFGDLLTPLLLAHFSRLEITHAPVTDADFVCVGSVLEHIPDGWGGTIVGAGKLHEESPLPVGRSQILALRGPLSARGVRGDFALGDPGLLANELVEVQTKKYRLGIVPHWSDIMLINRPEFQKYHPVIIDPRGDPLKVIQTIGECEKIVTSSLHGMILADAFGIPRRMEVAERFGSEGGLFKFKDYSQSIQSPLKVGETILADHRAVDDCKFALYDVFRALDRGV